MNAFRLFGKWLFVFLWLTSFIIGLIVVSASDTVLAQDPTPTPTLIIIEGEVQALGPQFIVVNGTLVDTSVVSVPTAVVIGSIVRIEGIQGANGTIIAQTLFLQVTDDSTPIPPTLTPTAEVTPPPTATPQNDDDGDDDRDDEVCPFSQGYWKNHPSAWVVTSLILGSQTYSQAELLALLQTPSQGDASLILTRQLIAAKLNIASGATDATGGAIAQGDTLLAAYANKLPYFVPPSSAEGQAMVNTGEVLDRYNNALWSDDDDCEAEYYEIEDAPVVIVIEGPVELIVNNIIYIYGIAVTIDPNDPVLVTIAIGDIVRVQANVTTDNLIIAVVVVIVVDIDAVIINNPVYGDCGNPPPPWAPAHGWRKKCDPNYAGYEGARREGRGDDDDDDDDDD